MAIIRKYERPTWSFIQWFWCCFHDPAWLLRGMGLLKLCFMFFFSWRVYFTWANIFWPVRRRPVVARSARWLKIAVINCLHLFFVLLFLNWYSVLFMFALQFLLLSFQLCVGLIFQKPLLTLWSFKVLLPMWLLANLICLPPPGWGWLLHQYLTDSCYSLSSGILLACWLHHGWSGCGFMSSNLGLGCCWDASFFHRSSWLLTVTIISSKCGFIEIFFIPVWIWICRVLFNTVLTTWCTIFFLFTLPRSSISCGIFSLYC